MSNQELDDHLSQESVSLSDRQRPPTEPITRAHGSVSQAVTGGGNRGPRSAASRKRPGVSDARISYPRKRSATACHLCRLRKTKCDNQRPVCGTCLALSVECVYQNKFTDFSKFDPGSLAILDRVNYAIQLLEGQSSRLLSLGCQIFPSRHSYHIATPTASNALGEEDTSILRAVCVPSASSNGTASVDLLDDNATTLTEALHVSANCSSKVVAQWPVFEGKIDSARINAYFFEPSKPFGPEVSSSLSSFPVILGVNCRTSHLGRGVCEEDALTLAQKFLEKVHIKNPILDPSSLMEIARKTAEEGFKWDESSCLVLIVCALANLATDFSLEKPDSTVPSYADAKDYTTAEQYYTAARKRIGLLDHSILTSQCSFLIGVYEMYSLRPLKAWLSFSNACTIFQTYLHSSSRNSLSHSVRRLEQRLYWSYLKSECEMRDEVNLPPTGLAKVDYPDIFPSPPGDTPEPEETGRIRMTDYLKQDFQHSWYYYLSEIASRRIGNRIIHALHMEPPEVWLSTPSKKLHRIAQELDSQIMQWIENLPYTLYDDIFQGPPDELQFMLKLRFLDLRERIWRPFLFIVIHAEEKMAEDCNNLEYAARSLSLVFQFIENAAIKHRHHGSWYGARQCFTKALMVLAAAKSGRIALRTDWLSFVKLVQTKLKYWEDESPDLRMARLTLSQILADICPPSIQSDVTTV